MTGDFRAKTRDFSGGMTGDFRRGDDRRFQGGMTRDFRGRMTGDFRGKMTGVFGGADLPASRTLYLLLLPLPSAFLCCKLLRTVSLLLADSPGSCYLGYLHTFPPTVLLRVTPNPPPPPHLLPCFAAIQK